MDTTTAAGTAGQPRSESPERTFLATVAHELRTPLHSANGFVEMVVDGLAGPLNERQQELLGLAHSAIGQLSILIEDVNFILRADNGEIQLKVSAVNPVALFDRSIATIHAAAREKGVSVMQTKGALPRKIQVDSERTRQGLSGLLRGALAMIPANGTLTVSTSADATRIVVAVALPDVRLDAEDMLHLFDRFYQPQPLGAERASYLGLSLVIAQLIAGWHGGKAYAETTPDGNLTLCYELPLGS